MQRQRQRRPALIELAPYLNLEFERLQLGIGRLKPRPIRNRLPLGRLLGALQPRRIRRMSRIEPPILVSRESAPAMRSPYRRFAAAVQSGKSPAAQRFGFGHAVL